ncbi:S8 family peptidase [Methylobacterium sp.]|uniref:S8 family peptidase n=1 Tax=Methylobacterium sp. TaxID=409 RepID=UPI003B0007F6
MQLERLMMTRPLSQADILGLSAEGAGVVLLPKFAFDAGSGATSSTAAAFRSASNERPEFVPTEQHAAARLEALGLQEVAASDLRSDLTGSLSESQGVFARFNALGLTAAYFRDRAHVDGARDALSDEFEVVPNFSLALPSRMRDPNVQAARGATMPGSPTWPSASGVAGAHAQNIKGSGVLVGVLDTGIDADHHQFAARPVPFRYVSFNPHNPASASRNVRGFDTDGHGTHVCGIISGATIGVAPEAELMVASVIESETARTSLIRVVYGLNWLLQEFISSENARKPALVNLSLGFPSTGMPSISKAEYNMRLSAIETVLKTLVQANVLPIVAIGNDGPGKYGYPGGFSDALGVGAVDMNGVIAGFSGSRLGRPRKPDLYGYGVDIYSSYERDSLNQSFYETLSGTSMAAPYVTGVAALYLCRQPSLSAKALRTMLLQNALSIKNGNRITKIARYL